MAKNQLTAKVVIPVRFSYLYAFTPRENDEGVKKYGVSAIFPKSDKAALKAVKAAIAEVKEDAVKNLFGGKLPRTFKEPLHDGDEREDEDPAYAGAYFLNANCNDQPGIVDKARKPILNASEIKSGDYGYVSLTFKAYDNKSKGIGCYLNSIMKTKDGAPLGAASNPEHDFKDIVVEDEEDFEEDDLLG